MLNKSHKEIIVEKEITDEMFLECLKRFGYKMSTNMTDTPDEFIDIIDKNFWDLFDEQEDLDGGNCQNDK